MSFESLTVNYLFPSWEQTIPSLGTKHSLRGNLRPVPASLAATTLGNEVRYFS